MSILIDQSTRVIVQGITGMLGRSETERMLAYGTKVVAGCVPGRGGERVFGVPVYNTVQEAMEHHEIDASMIYVPAASLKAAALEAINAGIGLVVISTERVPVHDVAEILEKARKRGVRVIGPNSQGVVSPGKSRLGGAGGPQPERVFKKGPVGVISRSGGMGTELCLMLSRAGLGQSTYVSTGGEKMVGMSFKDLLPLFQEDEETEAVVMFGEAGSSHEEEAAELIASGGFSKPVVAMVAGVFVERFPGVRFGHAGAIIERGIGSPIAKIKALREAGALIAETPSEVPTMVARLLPKSR